MRLPLTLHPANHVLAQCLLLRMALCSDRLDISDKQNNARHKLYKQVRHIADLPVPCSWEVRRQPLHGLEQLTLRSAGDVARMLKTTPHNNNNNNHHHDDDGVADTAALPLPARLIALYAPPVLLRRLPARVHDDVCHDAAVHHATLLARLLAPFGVAVSPTGATRRGSPVATRAEYLVHLTEEATAEVEALGGDAHRSTIESAAAAAVSQRRRRTTSTLKRDGLMIPHARDATSAPLPPPPPSAGGEDGVGGVVRPRQRCCTVDTALASTDVVSGPVSYRLRRALASLMRCGYAVSSTCSFPPTRSQLRERRAICLSVRYDPHLPTHVPPLMCTDARVLRRLQLHRVTLHVCPWYAVAARQLLLTGPVPFAAHVTLQALQRGVDVNMNGIFESGTTRCPAAGSGGGGDVVVHQLLLRGGEEEGDNELLELAGLPRVDPLLRSLYCQLHHL
ncbi:hypothetical protein NESM_000405700 [Novymonas esmeraldas]|uniref:Uncharacterized protein n=1 Tax=Novymonas esmeraldas TaxID=1808958 RepID=A0AAW0EL23_9TRYP